MSAVAASPETTVPIERLLKAWRGEVEAEAVYSVLAARETDRKRTAVLERMASAEVKHRRRIEHRLSELGVAHPDPAQVGISRWLRLQAWLAPRDRLLARMQSSARLSSFGSAPSSGIWAVAAQPQAGLTPMIPTPVAETPPPSQESGMARSGM